MGVRSRFFGEETFIVRWVMRSKIHNATVTEANLAYVGSITIDSDLLDAVGLWAGEKVLVVSNTSGSRLETYVIAGERGSGEICMNGAAAHLIGEGEEVIIMGFELTPEPITPHVILVDKANRLIRHLVEHPKREVASVL
jgi:aspartate 1-decarboxylase